MCIRDRCWSAAGILTTADGTVISDDYTMSANFMVYWDGDLGREVQDLSLIHISDGAHNADGSDRQLCSGKLGAYRRCGQDLHKGRRVGRYRCV